MIRFGARPALALVAAAAAVATVNIINTSVTERIVKVRPDPTINTYIQTWSNSGSQVGGIMTNGVLNLSGAIVSQGVKFNSGAVVTQGAGDARYVNTSGDTMTGALKVRASMSGSTMTSDGLATFGSGAIFTRKADIGWTVVAVANQACNTTCTYACVFGEDTSVLGTFVTCSDATADRCVCAGPN